MTNPGTVLVVQLPGGKIEIHNGASVQTLTLPPSARMLDIAEGILLYQLGDQIRARRVATGKDALLHHGSAAQLEHNGLTYAVGKRVHSVAMVNVQAALNAAYQRSLEREGLDLPERPGEPAGLDDVRRAARGPNLLQRRNRPEHRGSVHDQRALAVAHGQGQLLALRVVAELHDLDVPDADRPLGFALADGLRTVRRLDETVERSRQRVDVLPFLDDQRAVPGIDELHAIALHPFGLDRHDRVPLAGAVHAVDACLHPRRGCRTGERLGTQAALAGKPLVQRLAAPEEAH